MELDLSWSQKITVCVHPFFHHTRHSWNHAPYRKCDFTKKIYTGSSEHPQKASKGGPEKNMQRERTGVFSYLSNRDGEIRMFLFTCEALKENMQILVSPTYTVTIVLCLHKHCKTVNKLLI